MYMSSQALIHLYSNSTMFVYLAFGNLMPFEWRNSLIIMCQGAVQQTLSQFGLAKCHFSPGDTCNYYLVNG